MGDPLAAPNLLAFVDPGYAETLTADATHNAGEYIPRSGTYFGH
jgi:hypothetical protein